MYDFDCIGNPSQVYARGNPSKRSAFSVLWQITIEEVLPVEIRRQAQKIPCSRRSDTYDFCGFLRQKFLPACLENCRCAMSAIWILGGILRKGGVSAISFYQELTALTWSLVKRKRRLRTPQAACVPVSPFYRKHKDSDAFSVLDGSELLQETRSEELRICQGISRNHLSVESSPLARASSLNMVYTYVLAVAGFV
ncbi:uncharacterized protein ARMOST_16552 [Armillaria ostoyae]|uniref:Uncharacterized protein n=1 Tax=Armillaria ostoyae TaxID=47428 RepID=A0A284RWJ6_ARMOS|nr:uncharacterized protein ARMOST_16552 [Armillaria ostoyae]